MAATREITIPVRWADTSDAWREAVTRAVTNLDYKARDLEGWEPDHPLDPDYLEREGRVMWAPTRAAAHPTIELVRIRFRQKETTGEPQGSGASDAPQPPDTGARQEAER